MRKFNILLLLILLCLTGCGQENSLVETLPTAAPEKIEANQEGEGYLSDTDAQYFWGRDGYQALEAAALISEGNGGYYFLDGDTSLLCFYDPETGSAYPLCASPNCSHNSESCAAYWGNYTVFSVQYVNGALYLLASTQDELLTPLLLRVQSDGSGREKIYEVYQAEGSLSFSALIHRGYLYYTIDLYANDMSAENSATIFRRRLDGQGEAEEIYKSSAYYGCKIDLQVYGDYLYVQESGYTDEAGTAYTGNIGRISIHSLKYEMLQEGAYLAYAVNGSILYYDNGTQVVALDANTGAETVLYESGIPVYLAFDGTNLWLDNDCGIFILENTDLEDTTAAEKRTLTVLSTDGTVLQKLTIDDSELTVLFGDEGHLFSQIFKERDDGYYDAPICAADKSDILNGALEWSVLYGS